jgi:hypothetical protein
MVVRIIYHEEIKVSSPLPSPPPDPADDPIVTNGVIVLQKIIILLASVGITVPSILGVPQVQVQLVCAVIAVAAWIWSLVSHMKTAKQAVSLRTRVATAASMLAVYRRKERLASQDETQKGS